MKAHDLNHMQELNRLRKLLYANTVLNQKSEKKVKKILEKPIALQRSFSSKLTSFITWKIKNKQKSLRLDEFDCENKKYLFK